MEPYAEGNNPQFAVKIEPQDLSTEERDALTNQVQEIDGSGGLAPYEDFGIAKRGDLLRSLAAVCMQTGVIMLPDGSLQEPLFVIAEPMPPLRWEIDGFPES